MVCLCEGLVFVWCCLCDGAFCVRGWGWDAMFWGFKLDLYFVSEITFFYYFPTQQGQEDRSQRAEGTRQTEGSGPHPRRHNAGEERAWTAANTCPAKTPGRMEKQPSGPRANARERPDQQAAEGTEVQAKVPTRNTRPTRHRVPTHRQNRRERRDARPAQPPGPATGRQRPRTSSLSERRTWTKN